MRKTSMFLLIQSLLYLAYLLVDFSGSNNILSSIFKYIVILLCFIYAWSQSRNLTRERMLLRLVFLLTAIADLILLFLEVKYYIYGIISFAVIQQLYGFRIQNRLLRGTDINCAEALIESWMGRLGIQLLGAFLSCVALHLMGVSLDKVLILTVFYFISLVHNLVCGVKLSYRKDNKKDRLFVTGLFLFMLCDISVGLYNCSDYVDIPMELSGIINVFSIMMWLFYGPSQVLIALSIGASTEDYSISHK